MNNIELALHCHKAKLPPLLKKLSNSTKNGFVRIRFFYIFFYLLNSIGEKMEKLDREENENKKQKITEQKSLIKAYLQKRPEVIEIEQKIGSVISQALENGHKVNVEKLEGEKNTFLEKDVEAGTGRHPYHESRKIVYTDGRKNEGKWEEGHNQGSNPSSRNSSRTIEIEDATLVAVRQHIENDSGRDSYEYTRYIIRTTMPDVVKEVIKSKEVPELGGDKLDYEEIILGEQVNTEELETLTRGLPRLAQKAIIDTLKKDGYVETYHLNAPSVKITEVDETAGSGRYPYYHQEEIVFTDGEIKRGKQSVDRALGSNPDGGIEKTMAIVRNAKTVIVRDWTEYDDRDQTDESTILRIYSKSPEKYAKFSAKMAKYYRPEKEEDEIFIK